MSTRENIRLIARSSLITKQVEDIYNIYKVVEENVWVVLIFHSNSNIYKQKRSSDI